MTQESENPIYTYLLCSYYVRVLDWLVTGGPCDGTPVPESGLLTD